MGIFSPLYIEYGVDGILLINLRNFKDLSLAPLEVPIYYAELETSQILIAKVWMQYHCGWMDRLEEKTHHQHLSIFMHK